MEKQKNLASQNALQSTKWLGVMIIIIGILVFLPGVSASLTDGLISYWNFDEGTGTKLIDLAGTSNGTLTNTPSWVNGINGSALYFNGINQYVSIPHKDIYNTSLITISAWVRTNQTEIPDYPAIICKEGPVADRSWYLGINNPSHPHEWYGQIGDGGAGKFIDGGNNTLIKGWQFVTFTKNKTGLYLYQNEFLVSSKISNENMVNTTLSIEIAKYNDWYFNGTIDEIRIWNRSLSIDEISGLYWSLQTLRENSQTYNSPVMSGNTENFIINYSYDSSLYSNILGTLFYNGTSYTGTKYGSGNNIRFERSINVPIITSNKNFTFYWQVGLTNATGTFYYNSTFNNQTVLTQQIDDCKTYSVVILNYTMRDERTQVLINSTLNNATIEIDLQMYPIDSSTLLVNFSKIYNNNTALICFQTNLTNSSKYRLYSQVRYAADTYVTRYNYLQNFVLQNTTIPQKITLFDLQSIYATKFLITYKDNTFLAVPNALISLNKKYISEGVFKTVEVEKTDNLGQANAWFDLNGYQYQIVVSKEGVILSTFDNLAIFCEDQTIGNCKLNLDASATTTPVTDFYTYNNLNFAESFNSTNRIYTLIFSTQDNSVVNMSINLYKFDGYGNTTLCNNEVLTSSGTLTCSIPASYNNLTFVSRVYMDGKTVTSSLWTILSGPVSTIWGGNIVVFAVGIILTFGVMFIPSAIGVVIGTLIGLGFTIAIFAISGSILSGTFIFIVVAGGIIIYVIRNRGAD